MDANGFFGFLYLIFGRRQMRVFFLEVGMLGRGEHAATSPQSTTTRVQPDRSPQT